MLDDASRRTPDIESAAKSDISPPTGAERSRRQQERAIGGAPFLNRQKWTVLEMAYQIVDG